jgi:hypothetical protein
MTIAENSKIATVDTRQEAREHAVHRIAFDLEPPLSSARGTLAMLVTALEPHGTLGLQGDEQECLLRTVKDALQDVSAAHSLWRELFDVATAGKASWPDAHARQGIMEKRYRADVA